MRYKEIGGEQADKLSTAHNRSAVAATLLSILISQPEMPRTPSSASLASYPRGEGKPQRQTRDIGAIGYPSGWISRNGVTSTAAGLSF